VRMWRIARWSSITVTETVPTHPDLVVGDDA
jgi:hypothetical protein